MSHINYNAPSILRLKTDTYTVVTSFLCSQELLKLISKYVYYIKLLISVEY